MVRERSRKTFRTFRLAVCGCLLACLLVDEAAKGLKTILVGEEPPSVTKNTPFGLVGQDLVRWLARIQRAGTSSYLIACLVVGPNRCRAEIWTSDRAPSIDHQDNVLSVEC